MKTLISSVAALGVLAGAGTAVAQDFSVAAGVSFTTDYFSRGESQTEGRPAVQPYVEAEIGGFYAGIWASNVRFAGDPDRAEIDLYAGFRNSVGPVSYDIGYARYFYNRSGDCCGEFLLSFGLDTELGMSFGADLAYDHSFDVWTGSVSAAYAFNDMVNVSAEFGRVRGTRNFWNAGVGGALNDATSFDLRYHDSTTASRRVVATLSFDFALR